MRVISPSQTLILLGSFLLGMVNSGYFIMQMPFISHYAGTGKDREFTITSIVFYSATAIGNLLVHGSEWWKGAEGGGAPARAVSDPPGTGFPR